MAPTSNKALQHHWYAASCGRSLHYGRDDRSGGRGYRSGGRGYRSGGRDGCTYFVILSEAEGSPAIWHLPRIRPYNIISLLPAVGDPSTTVGMTEVEVGMTEVEVGMTKVEVRMTKVEVRMTGVEVEMAMAMAMAMIE